MSSAETAWKCYMSCGSRAWACVIRPAKDNWWAGVDILFESWTISTRQFPLETNKMFSYWHPFLFPTKTTFVFCQRLRICFCWLYVIKEWFGLSVWDEKVTSTSLKTYLYQNGGTNQFVLVALCTKATGAEGFQFSTSWKWWLVLVWTIYQLQHNLILIYTHKFYI